MPQLGQGTRQATELFGVHTGREEVMKGGLTLLPKDGTLPVWTSVFDPVARTSPVTVMLVRAVMLFRLPVSPELSTLPPMVT